MLCFVISNGRSVKHCCSHTVHVHQFHSLWVEIMSSSLVKFVLVGDCKVGKTTLRKSFSDAAFLPLGEHYQPSIGLEFSLAVSHEVKFQVWDTSGDERFRKISKIAFRGAQAFVGVFDVCSLHSFESMKEWISDALREGDNNSAIVIVGNFVPNITSAGAREVTPEMVSQFIASLPQHDGTPMYVEVPHLSSESDPSAREQLPAATQSVMRTLEKVVSVRAHEVLLK